MNEASCMVSILCTAYNHEAYIAQALESFVSQKTDFDFEVLVNDDLSTDNTAQIIRSYAEKYPGIIKPIFQEKNLFSQGKCIYTEVFFPICRGKYVAVCEGDDYWTDDTKLQRQVDFMEAHPDYSLCVHNTMLHYCDDTQADRPLLSRGKDMDLTLEDVIPGASKAYHTSSILARTELISQTPDFFWIAHRSGGFIDYAFALWLSIRGRIHYIDRLMSVYRIGSGASAWSTGVDHQYEKLIRFVSGELEMLKALEKHVPEEKKELVRENVLEREFELMYLEGRDKEQRKPPYRAILRRQSFSYRVNNFIKCALPGLHRLYRRKKGYTK